MPIDRPHPRQTADEATTLGDVLDFLRATVVLKVSGLTEAQARSHPVPASTMTPLGLVKHLTITERWWFSLDFAALDVPLPWPPAEDGQHDGFELSPTDTLATAIEAYQTECAASRAAVAGHPMHTPAKGANMHFTLRYALTHMIEETARHCGHLDLLRESLDGTRGE